MAEEVLTLEGLGPLTIRGRVAYGFCLVEQVIRLQGLSVPEIDEMLDDLRAFVSSDAVVEWHEMHEGKGEFQGVFGIMGHLDFIDSGRMKERLPDDSPLLQLEIPIMRMIVAAFDAATAYMYVGVEPGAPSCTEQVAEVLKQGSQYDLRLPPAALFAHCTKCSDSFSDSWGDTVPVEPFRAWLREIGA